MKEHITIDIDVDANVRIEGHDFTDNECAKVTAEIEKALGVVTAKTKKREYSVPAKAAVGARAVRRG